MAIDYVRALAAYKIGAEGGDASRIGACFVFGDRLEWPALDL